MTIGGNRYDLRELGGALGDLGTLVPFLLGYLTVNRMDPAGVLVAFGVCGIAAGLWFRTPVPVQPMKAIGTAAINHPATVTPGAIAAAGLVTGALWLVLGASGAATRIARLAGRPVVHGIVLGLGAGLAWQGLRMAAADPLVGVPALALALVLLAIPRVPALLVVLVGGVAAALVREPALLEDLGRLSWSLQLPRPDHGGLTWADAVTGALVLAVPQAALTFGNAVVATVEENNRLFPHRPLTVQTVALGHGVMNLAAAGLGGVPMCHGAGGMAGHVRFGARTGGATVMMGMLLLVAGLGLAGSVEALLRLLPVPVLGVILLLGALELLAGVPLRGRARADLVIIAVTAVVSVWNMGAGFLTGLALWHAWRRRGGPGGHGAAGSRRGEDHASRRPGAGAPGSL